MRLWPVTAAALLLGAHSPVRAADEGADYLVLTAREPFVLRLHVLVDGQSAAVAQARYWDRLFADLDRDGDGFLSKAEAARAPSRSFLRSFLDGGPAAEAKDNVVPFAALDTDHDGRVSRREFDAYYRADLDRSRLVIAPPDRDAAALTNVLFRLLDRDGDGRLSRGELKRAGESLRRVDFNDDEWITPNELLLTRAEPDRPVAAVAPVILSRADGSEAAWKSAVRQRYPRVEADALAALWGRVPDIELSVQLTSKQVPQQPGSKASRVEMFRPPWRGPARAKPIGATPAAGLRVGIAGSELDVDSAEGPETNLRGPHEFLRQQFRVADAEGKGSLTGRQAADSDCLAGLFTLADRDGDGVLTETELDAFLDLHAAGAGCFTVVTLTDCSPGLFGLLDGDGDGRLSLRELATAADRLLEPQREALTRDDLTRRWQLRLTPGKPAAARPAARAEAKAPAARGPEWFRKMDRNGDGYLSPREWLGPIDLFRRLDTDGDGLLSPEEAGALNRPALTDPRKR
jgi:Ca2+-binding EF-hand superfamily protein